MAHRSNLTQVKEEIDQSGPPEMVTDPVCGMEISRKESKHLVFRGGDPYYFCSRECQQKFLSPTFKKPAA